MLLALEKLRCMFTTCNAGERSLADAEILIWMMLIATSILHKWCKQKQVFENN